MDEVESDAEMSARARHEAQVRNEIRGEIDRLLAANRDGIQQALQEAFERVVAGMDDETRHRFTMILQGKLNQNISRMRARTEDLIQDEVDARLAAGAERCTEPTDPGESQPRIPGAGTSLPGDV